MTTASTRRVSATNRWRWTPGSSPWQTRRNITRAARKVVAVQAKKEPPALRLGASDGAHRVNEALGNRRSLGHLRSSPQTNMLPQRAIERRTEQLQGIAANGRFILIKEVQFAWQMMVADPISGLKV